MEATGSRPPTPGETLRIEAGRSEPLLREQPDSMSHIARSSAYWFVTLGALLCGGFYSAGEITTQWPWPLILYAVLLFPPYVIYVAVYDGPIAEVRGEGTPLQRSAKISISVAFSAVLVYALLWYTRLVNAPWANAILEDLNVAQKGYLCLLLVLHYYYAFSLLIFQYRRPQILYRVRLETFTPVLIVSFAFFVGATLRIPGFGIWLYAIPAAVFFFYLVFYYIDRRWPITPRNFAGFSAVMFLIAPTLALIDEFSPRTAWKFIAPWPSILSVAFALGLYLSLFELWRTTAVSAGRGLPEAEIVPQRTRYFNATLVSHALALLLLPVMFVVGSFGPMFLTCMLLHSTTAMLLWYRSADSSRLRVLWQWNYQWKLLKVVFGFTVFAIVALDIRRTGLKMDVPNLYPGDISGISASLFVAVLLAFLATPMVHYLTRGDGKHRSIRELTVGFFRLSHRSAVFRHAAVLSGVLFVSNDLLYEAVQKRAPGIAARASITFWVYAALTVLLSVIALFAEPEPDAMDSHQKPVTPPLSASGESGVSRLHRMWSVLIGVLQAARIVTALIVFAGIISIGIATGAPVWYSARLALAVALAAMASFALNDYYDQERDIINAPQRAIPSGKLTESEALFAALLFFLGAIVIGAHGLNGLALLVFLIGCIGGFAYNEFVRRWPAGKGLVTAFLCSLILVFDLLAFRLPVRFFLASVACFLFVAGRELLMDIRDIEGDRRAGLHTLAMYWSEARAACFGFAGILASLVPLCMFLAVAGGGRSAWLALLFYSATIGAAAVAWTHPGGRQVAIEIMKCSFIAGILVMVV